MATIDGENLLITLDPTGGVGTVDALVDLYTVWKDWLLEDRPDGTSNKKYPQAFRPDGGNDLTPGIKQGSYTFIRNDLGWRIRPAEEDATILFTGNLAPEDSTLPIMVPTLGGYTVGIFGLQPITQNVGEVLELQQDTSYNGTVVINTITGTPGTTYPIGTASEPVSNLADAVTIAARLGISRFGLHGALVITSDMTDSILEGYGTPAMVILAGGRIDRSTVKYVELSGDALNSADVLCENSRVSGVSNIQGSFVRCVFSGETSLVLGPGNSENFFGECSSYVPGAGYPSISYNNEDLDVQFRGWLGSLEIKNIDDAGSQTSFDISSGRLIIASTVTAGEIVVRGVGLLEDNSTADDVNTDGLVNPATLTTSVLAAIPGAPTIAQAWTRATTGGSKMRAIVSLSIDGEVVALPGTATLDILVRDSAGTAVIAQSGITPNASGFFALTEDPFTPTAGSNLASFATITNGADVYTDLTALSFPEFS
jgi:hypothetical protein